MLHKLAKALLLLMLCIFFSCQQVKKEANPITNDMLTILDSFNIKPIEDSVIIKPIKNSATIKFENPSFEDYPQAAYLPKGWLDCGFPNETPPDVQ